MSDSIHDSWVARLLEWEAGRTPGPIRVTLYATNRCNLRCAICWQRVLDVDRTELSDERLIHLVDECAALGVREWALIGGGEPMMRGDLMMTLCKKIRGYEDHEGRARAEGMNGTLHTNGTLLRREHFETLIRIGWNCVTVSLDGPSAEISDRIRCAGAFEKATARVRELAELKHALRANLPRLRLFMTLTRTNFHTIEDMVDLARDLECDAGLHLSMLVAQGEICEDLQLRDEHRKELLEHIHRGIERAGRYGIENNLASFLPADTPRNPPRASVISSEARDRRRFLASLAMTGRERRAVESPREEIADAMCFEPWLSLVVFADGKAGPCCASWDERADSIRDKPLRDVWAGPYLQEVRRRVMSREPLDYCRWCTFILQDETEARRKVLREYFRLAHMGPFERAAFLVSKAAASIRAHGLRKSLARGLEWVKLRRRAAGHADDGVFGGSDDGSE